MSLARRSNILIARLVAYAVLAYGMAIIADSLLRELRAHHGHRIDLLFVAVPPISGLGFTYLGTLLLRRKRNAWVAALVLFGVSIGLTLWHVLQVPASYDALRLFLPAGIVALLLLAQDAFRVRSDLRSFGQALRLCTLVLLVAFAYGVSGFRLLDDHDFHHEISLVTAAHLTVDQFGLTTDHPVAYTRRARLFMDSLTVTSVAAAGWAAISFFDPIRVRIENRRVRRGRVATLLAEYPSDLDDFFKLWPHDKLYYFDKTDEAGLAYHVTRGVALVVGNPFGNPKRFNRLLADFLELCFVNDWLLAFVHVDDRYRKLYEAHGLHLQKLGEEAVVDVEAFAVEARGKYFRQIRNRFTRLGYRVELLQSPHDEVLLTRLRQISNEWLERPGREERGFMLGYFTDDYLQQGPLAVLYDAENTPQGFINLVPTYEPATANYDMLRYGAQAPGNANDFLLLELLERLQAQGVRTFNLGLCPLSGVDTPESRDSTLVDQALRFVYANGDKLFSFSGLKRFKAKYHPTWEPRYLAYSGGVRNFTRAMRALNRAMKVR